MKTLVMSGSVRSTQGNLQKLNVLAKQARSINELCSLIQKDIDRQATYCNSDILTAVALMSMHQNEVAPIPFSLASLFKTSSIDLDNDVMPNNMNILTERQQELCTHISQSSGLLLITPVYFGDRSSVANKLLQIAGKTDLFENKVFGCASVGAKRNGGQETTVIYCLLEALKNGSLIVGNGPPTAQYGGTAMGGHKGTVIKDEWGLLTTYGVASRIVEIAKLYQHGLRSRRKTKLRILVLVTMDNSKRYLLDLVKSYAQELTQCDKDVEIVVLDTLKHVIYRCIGCKYCPADGIVSDNNTLSLEKHARCAIKNDTDGIHTIQKEIIQSDAVLVAGLNAIDAVDITYRYQVLVERTRYMRRDNFEMTNKLLGSFTLHEVGAQSNTLHFVKTVTSYIRHNVVIARPIDVYMHNNEIIADGKQSIYEFVDQAKRLKTGKDAHKIEPPKYITSGIGGYE